MEKEKLERRYKIWTWVLSLAIPLAVAVLFRVRILMSNPGFLASYLCWH